jgi:hypothetical protein
MDQEVILWILNTLFGICFVVTGWFARQLWDAVNLLKKDLSSLEIRIAREYVPHDRLKDAFDPVMTALAEIKDTLKTKADK